MSFNYHFRSATSGPPFLVNMHNPSTKATTKKVNLFEFNSEWHISVYSRGIYIERRGCALAHILGPLHTKKKVY